MRASVCLCTYNGERYLPEQLESLATQTEQPFELLVADDGSTDATPTLVEAFARHAPFPVELVRNKERRGPAASLEGLLEKAAGDIILPCDQDDRWMPDKIAFLARRLEEVGGPLAAVCNSLFVDDEGRGIGGSLFERMRVDAGTIHLLSVPSSAGFLEIVRRDMIASHAICLKREALVQVLPFGYRWHADWWMALVLSATSGLALVDRPLVAYRLHEGNTVGMRDGRPLFERVTQHDAERFGSRAELLAAALERVSELAPGVVTDETRTAVLARVAHLRARGSLPARKRGKRLGTVVRELSSGRYGHFSNGWKSALADLLRESERLEPRRDQ